LNFRDQNGNTFLHEAVLTKNSDLVDLLIKNGVKVNSKNNFGKTALHKACFIGSLSCVSVLLINGADVAI